MKTLKNLLLSGIAAALFCATANAQVLLYSNAFNGGTNGINATAPTYATNILGANINAKWICTYSNNANPQPTINANGTIGTNAGSAVLPITIQSGAVYYLTASCSLPAAGNWVALGFCSSATTGTNQTAERFTDSNVKGVAWASLRANVTVNFFGGPETALSTQALDFEPSVGSNYTVTIILNTLGSKWAASGFVNGTLQGTNVVGGTEMTNLVYASNPAIGYFGFTQQAISPDTMQWNYITLSTALLPVFTVQPPAVQPVSSGANITLNSSAIADTNGGTIAYQWYSNNVAISGATNTALTFNSAAVGANTNFYLVATNKYGASTNSGTSLAVYTTPTFLAQTPITYTNPINLYGGFNLGGGTNYFGSSPTFTVTAVGQLPMSYQWVTNGVPMTGATSSSLTFTDCQMTGPTNFACVISNSDGEATNSGWSVSYTQAPMVAYPQAVLADNPIAYWRLDEPADSTPGEDGEIANDWQGGNNGIYTNVALGESGYSTTDPTETSAGFGIGGLKNCTASQIEGIDFANETTAEFTVAGWALGIGPAVDAPIITKGIYGVNDAFLLGADTTAKRTYQFYVRAANGIIYTADNTNASAYGTDGLWHFVVGVCDQANSNLTLYIDGKSVASTNMPTTAGNYEANAPVQIGQGSTNVTTTVSTLQFNGFLNDISVYSYAMTGAQVEAQYLTVGGVPPSWVQAPPATMTVNANAPLSITASAYGNAPIGYYWTDLNGGTNVATGTTNNINLNATLNYPSVPTNWNGDQLELTVTNAFGSPLTAYVNLIVNSGAPLITTDVVTSFGTPLGGTASNSVSVSGSAPFTYQWQFDGTNLSNGGEISGALSSAITIANAQITNGGSYQVIVSNAYGSVTSSIAQFAVIGVEPLGFNGTGLGWSLTQAGAFTAPVVSNNVLTLTDGHGDESRGLFFDYPQYIGAFEAGFTYSTAGGADGASFCIQDDSRGLAAIGGIGGQLGVAAGNGELAISPSFELEFNIYALNGIGGIGYCFQTNGVLGNVTAPGDVSLTGTPVDVSLYYASGQLSMTLSNDLTTNVFTTNLALGSLPQLLGNSAAYIGFTGSDGGVASTQVVSNFWFVSLPMAAIQLSSGNALVTWPGEIEGYVLQANNNLATTNWVNVTNQVILTNNTYEVEVPATGSNVYYRLFLP